MQKSGLTEGELIHLEWQDLKDGYIDVRSKPQYGHVVKAYHTRKVYIPADLARDLLTLKITAKHSLVFPTKGGNVNKKLLRTCKRIVKRAGLDPSQWWLHAFRSSFATHCLKQRMDLESVRAQMGHSRDSKSLWHYLTALQGEKLAAKVSQVWA